METEVTNVDIHSPGSFTIRTENGSIESTPTRYNFSNDLSKGCINNSMERLSSLQSSQNITLNHNLTVGGSSQTNVGGLWADVGSYTLQNGAHQRMASSTNDELYALLAQYPDNNNGEIVFNPLPNLEQNYKKSGHVTAETMDIELPTIKGIMDIPKWIAAWTEGLVAQNTVNSQARTAIAMQSTKEDLDEQIKVQETHLKEKFGEEIYNLYYKTQIEAGGVYLKQMNPYTITKDDLYSATLGEGKCEKRNAHLAKIG